MIGVSIAMVGGTCSRLPYEGNKINKATQRTLTMVNSWSLFCWIKEGSAGQEFRNRDLAGHVIANHVTFPLPVAV